MLIKIVPDIGVYVMWPTQLFIHSCICCTVACNTAFFNACSSLLSGLCE